jgi:hypothetical protein
VLNPYYRPPAGPETKGGQVCWSGPEDGVEIARQFGLGGGAELSEGPVARGGQGLVWRLDTDDDSWAVKAPLFEADEDEVRSTA